MKTLYRAENLCIDIGGTRIAEGISFAIAPGEILALAGASGAGKSMTAMTPFGLTGASASGSVTLSDRQLMRILPQPFVRAR